MIVDAEQNGDMTEVPLEYENANGQWAPGPSPRLAVELRNPMAMQLPPYEP